MNNLVWFVNHVFSKCLLKLEASFSFLFFFSDKKIDIIFAEVAKNPVNVGVNHGTISKPSKYLFYNMPLTTYPVPLKDRFCEHTLIVLRDNCLSYHVSFCYGSALTLCSNFFFFTFLIAYFFFLSSFLFIFQETQMMEMIEKINQKVSTCILSIRDVFVVTCIS